VIDSVAIRAAACTLPLLLAACALDAPRLAYQCPQQLSFEARLYQDMALLEGLRGHVVLERETDDDAAALQYADPTVRATFGLGLEQRLVRLDYTSIPAPVYCERAATDGAQPAPVQAAEHPGPRPPPPFDPNAPVETNIRFDGGPTEPHQFLPPPAADERRRNMP
jgi:hypothetical protein